MSDRIRDLAMSVQSEGHWTEEDIQKFGALLVQECAKVIKQSYAASGWQRDREVAKRIAALVKKEFSVK